MGKILLDWNNKEIGVEPAKDENPMLVHGYGPTGAHCRGCTHLVHQLYKSKTYLKCDLYKITRGPGSDFRAKWPACKKYEQAERQASV